MLPLDRQNAWRADYAAAHPGWQPSGLVYEARVRRYVHPAVRWLDVGCGRGGIVEQLGQAVTLCIGLDLDPTSLREHRADHVRLTVGRLDDLPYPDHVFDLVTCSWVIEHLPHPAHAFAEIARILKPAGHLVFLTPNALNYVTWLGRLAPTRLQSALVRCIYQRVASDTFPVYYRANTPARLAELLGQCGLQRAALQLVGDPTYLAFHPCLFRLSKWLERRLPPAWRVHIVGDYSA
jgi:SAM-dependent methyltransferase